MANPSIQLSPRLAGKTFPVRIVCEHVTLLDVAEGDTFFLARAACAQRLGVEPIAVRLDQRKVPRG